MPADRNVRIACLQAALFPLAAWLRADPELGHEAVVVHEGPSARIVAASRLARRAGVRPGLTLAQARQIESALLARSRDPERERTAQEVLLEIADAFSPRVEDSGEGTVCLDLTGLGPQAAGGRRSASASARQSGDAGESGSGAGGSRTGTRRGARPTSAADADRAEHELGQSMMRDMDAAGLPGRVGIGGSKLVARAAAALPQSPNVVPPGGEARFLAPLPLRFLIENGGPGRSDATPGDQQELLHTLKLWGLHTVGDLAALPAGEVHSRLGERGAALHAAARGVDPEPLVPRPPPVACRESQTLEWPIDNLEPFLFLARAAVERLVARLDARSMGCKRLELSLSLEPDGLHELAIELPAPTCETRTLVSLLRLHLEGEPPRAPIASVQLVAHPDVPRQDQLSLLGPTAPSPDRLAAVTARLLALLGPRRVGSPRTRNGHLPERSRVVDHDPPPPPRVRLEPRPGRNMLAVRTLRPPVEVEVVTRAGAERSAPCPEPVRISPLPTGGRHVRIEGAVHVAAGPWEIEEGWWREQPACRDYWDVELRSGAVCRIYRDRASERWYADGIYD